MYLALRYPYSTFDLQAVAIFTEGHTLTRIYRTRLRQTKHVKADLEVLTYRRFDEHYNQP